MMIVMEILVAASHSPILFFVSGALLLLAGFALMIGLVSSAQTVEPPGGLIPVFTMPLALVFLVLGAIGLIGTGKAYQELRPEANAMETHIGLISAVDDRVGACTPGSGVDEATYTWYGPKSEGEEAAEDDYETVIGTIVKSAEEDGRCVYELIPQASK